jgi:pimeloyl-ACP methyl ester carboxylesterase
VPSSPSASRRSAAWRSATSSPRRRRLRARHPLQLPELRVERHGHGPPVVLVHGSVTGAASTWRKQLALARRWTLLVVERPGFGGAPAEGPVDFAVDALLVAGALGEGGHLVGQSYGGVVSLLAAAQRPDAVRSLTVIEPPAFGVAVGDPAADEFIRRGKELWAKGTDDPAAFLPLFLDLVGAPQPSRLSPELEQGARLLRTERGPWEAEIPLDALAAAPLPTLVISGAPDAAFDAVCDVLEERLAAERLVLAGAGHSVQRLGAPFNERLEAFLRSAEAGR